MDCLWFICRGDQVYVPSLPTTYIYLERVGKLNWNRYKCDDIGYAPASMSRI